MGNDSSAESLAVPAFHLLPNTADSAWRCAQQPARTAVFSFLGDLFSFPAARDMSNLGAVAEGE
jgi:hypothetical protein